MIRVAACQSFACLATEAVEALLTERPEELDFLERLVWTLHSLKTIDKLEKNDPRVEVLGQYLQKPQPRQLLYNFGVLWARPCYAVCAEGRTAAILSQAVACFCHPRQTLLSATKLL